MESHAGALLVVQFNDYLPPTTMKSNGDSAMVATGSGRCVD